MSRYIPVNIRKKLRNEVNYGCPVSGCGSPYLSYHHFDPPYEKGESHNPEGMIALCLGHHKQADIGTFTNKQLRELKQNPFLSEPEVKGRINWLRNEVIFKGGGFLAIRTNTFLKVAGKKTIWAKRTHNGTLLLNMDVRRKDGSKLLQIIDNDWVVRGPISDLEVTTGGRIIDVTAPQNGVTIKLKFEQCSRKTLREKIKHSINSSAKAPPPLPPKIKEQFPPQIYQVLTNSYPSAKKLFEQKWRAIKNIDLHWPVLFVTLKGNLVYPRGITFDNRRVMLPGNNMIEGGMSVGGAISLG